MQIIKKWARAELILFGALQSSGLTAVATKNITCQFCFQGLSQVSTKFAPGALWPLLLQVWTQPLPIYQMITDLQQSHSPLETSVAIFENSIQTKLNMCRQNIQYLTFSGESTDTVHVHVEEGFGNFTFKLEVHFFENFCLRDSLYNCTQFLYYNTMKRVWNFMRNPKLAHILVIVELKTK